MNKLNNKGFTLVEIIGVIALLAIIMIIATTSGLGAFNNAKTKLKEEDEKTIVEAAKVLMTEVLYCDEDLDKELLKNTDEKDFSYINALTNTDPSSLDYPSCENLLKKAKTTNGLKITLKYLYENKLVTGIGIEEIYEEDESNDTYEIKYIGKIDSNNNISIEKEGI